MENLLFFVVRVHHLKLRSVALAFRGRSIHVKLKGELHSHVVSFKQIVQTVRNVNTV